LDTVKAMRDAFRLSAGKDAIEALKKVDKMYPAYLTVKKASSAAHAAGGKFNPQQLSAASNQMGGRTGGTGAPLLETSEIGMETIGRKQTQPLMDFFRATSAALPSPLVQKGGGQAILGETGWQKAIAKRLREMGRVDEARALAGAVLPALEE